MSPLNVSAVCSAGPSCQGEDVRLSGGSTILFLRAVIRSSRDPAVVPNDSRRKLRRASRVLSRADGLRSSVELSFLDG